MNRIDINEQVASLLDIDKNEVYAIKDVCPESLGFNLYYNGVWVDFFNERIIFTSKRTAENWDYYKGFEYIDEDMVETVDMRADFVKVYNSTGEDGCRVLRVIEMCEEPEENLDAVEGIES